MKCPIETRETLDVLLAYSAGKLDPEAAALLERHMESCPACRQWSAGQRAVWDALDEWDAPLVPVDFDRRLYRRIDEEERSGWWRRLARPLGPVLVRRWLPVMAAACLLVVAGAILDRSPAPAPLGGEVTMETVQADQVERTLEDMELLQGFNQEVRAPVSSPM